MPISETEWNNKPAERVDMLVSSSLTSLSNLPKKPNIKDYLVCVDYKNNWVVPQDKYGLDLYRHWCTKVSVLDESIVIPIDILRKDFPELIITSSNDSYCRGIPKENSLKYKRDFELKKLLNEQNYLFSNSVFEY